ncbi:GerAB/ArcD/ProY family transporter [Paenibacillus thalictri]|uniref:Spore gernimation protein n=1 Tax=Paenibacillus thalictri TaxID=2527873 RepID=A0A4Q9DW06_9BACL|nr:endospore germination permease [Paenibacillus thalictri]TBL81247.1 spore gernimation protein [Paenibacillus thalictri]
MENGGKINSHTFTILVAFFMIGTSILITPAGLAVDARQDAWLACLTGLLVNLLLVLLYAALGKRFGELSVIGFCERAFGKWLGKAAGLVLTLFYYLLASLMVGDLGFFLTSQIVPETPIEMLQILFVLTISAAVYYGVKIYGRAAEIFFPIMLVLFLLLIVPLLHRFHFNNVMPLMENGIKPVLKGAYSFFGLQEMGVLLMLYPFVGEGKGRAMIVGTVIGGIVLAITTFSSIAVLGASLTANQLFPAYTLAKNINIGNFIQRLEGNMMLIWVLTIFMKVVITFHASLLGMVQVFNLKSEKPYVAPLALGMVSLSLICYPDTLFSTRFLARNWTALASFFMIFLPLLLLAVSVLRHKLAVKKQ